MAVLASPDVGIRGRALLRIRRIYSGSNAYSADRRRIDRIIFNCNGDTSARITVLKFVAARAPGGI